jgi:hypothetical protein
VSAIGIAIILSALVLYVFGPGWVAADSLLKALDGEGDSATDARKESSDALWELGSSSRRHSGCVSDVYLICDSAYAVVARLARYP